MKKPEECLTLADVRTEIDRIDLSIIQSLSERAGYVASAAGFKKDPAAVRDSARVREVIETRRVWADKAGLNPDFIENLFAQVTAYFISRETQKWETDRRQNHVQDK